MDAVIIAAHLVPAELRDEVVGRPDRERDFRCCDRCIADLGSASETRRCPARRAGDPIRIAVTSSKWLDGIMSDGLREGTYATPSGNLTRLEASLGFALPPNRSLSDATIRIDLVGLSAAGYEIPSSTRVSGTVAGSGGRVYTMPGGGDETRFPYGIPPRYLSVVPR